MEWEGQGGGQNFAPPLSDSATVAWFLIFSTYAICSLRFCKKKMMSLKTASANQASRCQVRSLEKSREAEQFA